MYATPRDSEKTPSDPLLHNNPFSFIRQSPNRNSNSASCNGKKNLAPFLHSKYYTRDGRREGDDISFRCVSAAGTVKHFTRQLCQ